MNYFEFIAEWAGFGFLVPIIFAVLGLGPILFYMLDEMGSPRELLKNTVLICSICSGVFVFLGTGAYFSKALKIGGWGMLITVLLMFALLCIWDLLIRKREKRSDKS
ncbi:MAG: hypothetical protein ACK5R4_06665 [Alphaproteobacteria bacterium]|jgi:NhaP-type Na+/H+ or K+/H+ antiporter